MKLTWLINPLQFQEQFTDFPVYLANKLGTSLDVLFLETSAPEFIPVMSNDPVFPTADFHLAAREQDEERSKLNEEKKELVRASLGKQAVSTWINEDTVVIIENLLEHSRFTDLLLVNATLSFNTMEVDAPSDLVQLILEKAECPVIVLPEDQQEVREIYFTYNGSYSSVYAIKQFNYLFPTFKDIPVTILYVQEEDTLDPAIIEHIKSLLQSSYSQIQVKILQGDTDSELLAVLGKKKNVLVTYGAYGRSRWSRFFHKSTANEILHAIDIPAFITHH